MISYNDDMVNTTVCVCVCVCVCVWIGSDHHGRRLAQVVVMDATKYYYVSSQFNSESVRRELDKVCWCCLIAWLRWIYSVIRHLFQSGTCCVMLTIHQCLLYDLQVVWLSSSALVSINIAALHRARLVLGWVTICEWVNYLSIAT